MRDEVRFPDDLFDPSNVDSFCMVTARRRWYSWRNIGPKHARKNRCRGGDKKAAAWYDELIFSGCAHALDDSPRLGSGVGRVAGQVAAKG